MGQWRDVVAALTLDEKAALTAGADLWSTVAIERLGLPKVFLTDGPNGARGPGLGSLVAPSTCFPCGAALGATWDTALVERVGGALGREARARGCRVLLAPTVNIHRSPLAGRNFECYGEDPLHSGRLAAAFVRGVQGEGVIATVKHFVGNETETERYSSNSVVDERALREIYLRPFEIAVRDGGALGVMTSYNRVNSRWVSEDRRLLTGVLRGEWGFDGIVMTDWFAVAGTVDSARAGVDLEMPGPGRAFGAALADAVRSGAVDEAVLDAMVTRLLETFDRAGALGDATAAVAVPEADESHRELARTAAAAAMVLLRNDGTLPLDVGTLRRVAVIGANAGEARIMGGGSSQVQPHRLVSPLDALRHALGDDIDVVYERGCEPGGAVRPLRVDLDVDVFGADPGAGPVAHTRALGAELLFVGAPPGLEADTGWSLRATGRYVPDVSGPHELTLAQSGRARVLVDGAVVLDGVDDPPLAGGSDFFGLGSVETHTTVELVAHRAVEITIDYVPDGAAGVFGVKVGCRPPVRDDALARAVAEAAAADVAVVVVGTSDDWETEGRDRSTMDLPGGQDELVAAIAAASSNTVVVVNTGAPVTMHWCDDVAAVLQCWFGGEEMAAALADVLTGAIEPSGRLPFTIPRRLEHNPSHGNFPGENGTVRYGEGVFVGYRGYQAHDVPVRFPFGHGLGYATFDIGEPRLSSEVVSGPGGVEIDVPVTNRGVRGGSEVVQCYVAPRASRLARPPRELVAFAKVAAGPGETVVARMRLDARAFSYWDPGQPDFDAVQARVSRSVIVGGVTEADRRDAGWQCDPGRYDVLVGRSCEDIAHAVAVEVVAHDGR